MKLHGSWIIVLSVVFILQCGNGGGSGGGHENGENEGNGGTPPVEVPPSAEPRELIRNIAAMGTTADSDEIWYFFNGSVRSDYVMEWKESGNGAYDGDIQVSAYKADKTTPYFADRDTGPQAFKADSCGRVYLKVRKRGEAGSFELRYRIDNATAPPTWTVMVYANCSDLESDVVRNIKEMKEGYHKDISINIVLLIDKESVQTYDVFDSPFADTRLYAITVDGLYRMGGGAEFPEITLASNYEANMGDPEVLRKFIEYSKANFPADRYALIFHSHGNGCAGFSGDDLTGGDRLHLAELGDALDGGHSVDLLGFNCCLMGNLEVAYQFRKVDGENRFCADVMVGAPVPVVPYGWAYDKTLQRINIHGGANGEEDKLSGGIEAVYDPAMMTATELASIIIEEHRDEMFRLYPDTYAKSEALSCYDLAKAANVKKHIDELARSLYEHGERTLIETIRDDESLVTWLWTRRSAQTDAYYKTYQPVYEVVDLCAAVENEGDFHADTRACAAAAKSAILDDKMLLFSYYSDDFTNTRGMSIFFSNGDDLYEDRPMYEFQWWYNAADVTVRGLETDPRYAGKIAWCMDGAIPANGVVENWFEMLDAWYDGGGNAADGGWNGYRY